MSYFVASFIVLFSTITSSDIDLNQIAAAQTSFEGRLPDMVANYTMTSKDPKDPKGTVTMTTKVKYSKKGGLSKCEVQESYAAGLGLKDRSTVYAINNLYGFELQSRDGQPYVATKIATSGSAQYLDIANNVRLHSPTSVYFLVGTERLPAMMRKKGFKVLKHGYSSNGQLLDLHFDYQRSDKDPYNPVRTGILWLSVANGYAIQKYDIEMQNPARQSWRVSLDSSSRTLSDGLCLPKQVTRSHINNTTLFVYEDPSDGSNLLEKEFTLPHYGMPEPPLSHSARMYAFPWYLWLSILGIICIVVAIYVQSRRKVA